MTYSFLWLRHAIERRKRPRCNASAGKPECQQGKVLFAQMLVERQSTRTEETK